MSVKATWYTVGHSNHTIDTFVQLLKSHNITHLCDVRTFPSSKRFPHFASDSLCATLSGVGVHYQWLKALGGKEGDIAQRIESEPQSAEAFDTLVRLALSEGTNVAMMCSEGLWTQCHRQHISTVAVSRGHKIIHIMPDGNLAEHTLATTTPGASLGALEKMISITPPVLCAPSTIANDTAASSSSSLSKDDKKPGKKARNRLQ
eukprot:PhM_4_TR14573/c0_g1_i1/m.32314